MKHEMNTKEILFIDMDGVLVDFKTGIDATSAEELAAYADDGSPMHKTHYDDIPHIFSRMKPVEGAVEAVKQLSEKYDVYILSTAPWGNPSAWSDKLEWVKRNFDSDENKEGVFYKRLILSHHKNLCYQPGAWMIDDRPNHGAEDFGDRWIQFHPENRNWEEITKYLLNRDEATVELEAFCQKHGFVFRIGNDGTRRHPYWSFFKVVEGDTKFSIEYYPGHRFIIQSPAGKIDVQVRSVAHLLAMLNAMKIDLKEVDDKSQA